MKTFVQEGEYHAKDKKFSYYYAKYVYYGNRRILL